MHTKSCIRFFPKKIVYDKLFKIIGGIMLSLKDPSDLDDYNYKVCEISGCEEEAVEIYEDDTKVIDVCYQHDKELNANKWTLW